MVFVKNMSQGKELNCFPSIPPISLPFLYELKVSKSVWLKLCWIYIEAKTLYYTTVTYSEFSWEQGLFSIAGGLRTFGADFQKDSDVHL